MIAGPFLREFAPRSPRVARRSRERHGDRLHGPSRAATSDASAGSGQPPSVFLMCCGARYAEKGLDPGEACHSQLFVVPASHFGRGGLERRGQKRLLRHEMSVEAAGREPCLLHDLVNPRRVIPLTAENLACRPDDLRPGPLLVTGRISHGDASTNPCLEFHPNNSGCLAT